MKLADRIRTWGRDKYVVPARENKLARFSIRTGDVVSELGIGGSRAPAVCSALKTNQFLENNQLNLVATSGPKSGQSTTVIYTYEFVEKEGVLPRQDDSWGKLRGGLKDIFADLGGGEEYLRSERGSFHAVKGNK
jgi:hypothetical protein